MASSQQIAVYSIADLKNTTDDALIQYLVGKKRFTSNHILSDIRLTLGYASVVVAAVTFYFDYTSTWENTKDWTFWAVIAYFVLNGALTLWIWGVEKGKVFNGSKGDVLVSFASQVNKYEPLYRLKIRHSDPSRSAPFDWQELQIQSPFAKWFTADGQLVAESFRNWLASSIPLLQGQSKLKNET